MNKVKDLAGTFEADELITIALEDGGNFTVQKALLLCTSRYFVSALESGFQETQTKRLQIPGCSTETFELLLYWMSTSKLPDFVDTTNNTVDWTNPYMILGQVALKLVRLWAIADQLMLPKLQNVALKSLDTIFDFQIVAYETVKVAFEVAGAESGIAKLAVREFCANYATYPGHYSESQLNELGRVPGFLLAFTTLMMKYGNSTESLTAQGSANLSDYLEVEED